VIWMVRVLLKLAMIAGVIALVYLGVTFVQVWSAARHDDAEDAGAIIVMGAAQYDGEPSPVLRARLDHAVELYEDGIAPVVVVTGGNQPGDRFTEASTGVDYLLAAGIPRSALRAESEGTNSWESLAAAADLLISEGVTEVVLVSSPYHSLRIEHIADEVGLTGHASPAMTTTGMGSVVRLGREAVAVGVGRLIGYDRLVDLDHQVDKART
jgi:vancomycin permeability regulator SanA